MGKAKFWRTSQKIGLKKISGSVFVQLILENYWEKRKGDSLMLATIGDDT